MIKTRTARAEGLHVGWTHEKECIHVCVCVCVCVCERERERERGRALLPARRYV